MTDGESLDNVGANAYAKPATALTILRETILGRELFDFAFREYATRWMFKRAAPSDFFRTLEDASGVDLDWFWRAWFYGSDHVDIAIDGLAEYTFNTQNPDTEKPLQRQKRKGEPRSLTEERNEAAAKADEFYKPEVEQKPELKDFYNANDRFTVTNADRNKFNDLIKGLKPWEKELLGTGDFAYVMDFKNVTGMPMPVILGITYKDGSTEELRIPADVWRQDNAKFSKLIVRPKQVAAVEVDPRLETADVDTENNHWPRKIVPSRLELFKQDRPAGPNLMKDMDEPLKKDEPKKDETKEGESQTPPQ
jgi:hypothetical protein